MVIRLQSTTPSKLSQASPETRHAPGARAARCLTAGSRRKMPSRSALLQPRRPFSSCGCPSMWCDLEELPTLHNLPLRTESERAIDFTHLHQPLVVLDVVRAQQVGEFVLGQLQRWRYFAAVHHPIPQHIDGTHAEGGHLVRGAFGQVEDQNHRGLLQLLRRDGVHLLEDEGQAPSWNEYAPKSLYTARRCSSFRSTRISRACACGPIPAAVRAA